MSFAQVFQDLLCFGCPRGISKSVKVLFNGIEAVAVLTLMILKQRALQLLQVFGCRFLSLPLGYSVRVLGSVFV